jgi:predicted ATPase
LNNETPKKAMKKPMRRTNWCVITGAPCSGKTSVIKELEGRGYRVVHESARAYIDQQLAAGRRLDQIKADERAFENHILNAKLVIESTLRPNETIFFDRGLPDSIAYFKLAGLDADTPLEKSKRRRYRRIFFFERLGFLKDRVRSEDEDTADRLSSLIEESYRLLQYEIIHVPVLSIEQRIDFILNRL